MNLLPDHRRWLVPDRRRWLLTALSVGGAASGLVGCANTPSPAASAAGGTAEDVVAPNANLVVQGIPPIPAAIARRVALYTEFRGHGLVDWHPQRREMLVSHRKAGASVPHLFLVRAPMAEPEQLTDGSERVTVGSFEPREGRYLVYEQAQGGSEADQIYRLDLDTRTVATITLPDERHALAAWLRTSSRLLHTSVPLDRTAQGGTRAEVVTSLWLVDPLQPAGRRRIADLPGGGWSVGGVSRDERRVSLTHYISANESQVWLLDLATGARTQVLPAPTAAEKATHFAGEFSPDGKQLFVTSDRASEFREMMALDLASGALTRVTGHIPWDVSGGGSSDDGRFLALALNVDGREELRLFDGRTLKELPAPASLPAGSVGAVAFRARDSLVGFTVNSAQGPSQIHALDAATGRSAQWTRAYAPPGIDPSRFGSQRIVRWKSFDGLSLSGILNAPPARFTGRRPVIVDIHGGPEAQATLGFMGRWAYFVEEMGLAIVQPNVRGSTGYGKTFLALDNGRKREDSVKDIGALLDWIATQPGLDPTRVLVVGGSYGGYMSLATSVHYADRIAGAIDIVGISNFVTFLTNTESYRRDLRRVEYGDERDPAMRTFLEGISPLNNAQRIRKPLFVVQGKNDPRVPYTEAEQIVQRVRANGSTVWYLRAENEGHGFARKENADFLFYATVKFIEQTLLG